MTLGSTGISNLAPFSYFGLVADDPILLMLSIGRRDGHSKDTAQNLLDSGEAVVHVVEESLFEPMVLSSKELAATESELDLVGLRALPSTRVRPLRLERASIALECVVDRHFEAGNDANDVFLLRAVYAHIDDGALSDGLPDPKKLRIMGKLGGANYAVTEITRSLKRP
jgi:flavin reductase (DIM6/NTAB) family NADH-FMN oxidoreductase RutF